MRRRLLLSNLAATIAAPALAGVDDPFHLVVAYPAGGPSDLLARQLEPIFHTALGRPVLVENAPGAAGAIGVTRVLSAPKRPMALVGTMSEAILAPLLNRALTYTPDQLRLLGPITHVPIALVGGTHLKAQTLKDLLSPPSSSLAPRSYGSYGIGSHAHLVGAEFAARARLDLQHIPYGGIAVLLRDLLGNQIDLAFLPVNRQLRDFADKGQLRLYGIASTRSALDLAALPRLDAMPGLESFRYDIWLGLFVSRQASPSRLQEARIALHGALADPGFRELKRQEGIEVAEAMTEMQADHWHASEIERYRVLAEQAAPNLQV